MTTGPAKPEALPPRGEEALFRVVSTGEHDYLYDAATNRVLSIDGDLARALREGVLGPEAIADVAKTRGDGVLWPTSGLPFSSGAPTRAEVENAVHHACRQVVLEATRDCNMRCRYCTYSGRQPTRRTHSNQSMPSETALAAVDWLAARSSDCDHVSVSFFGGEPLLALPLLERTVEHARQALAGKPIVFSVTTNGTLLTPEVAEFLVANDFTTLVSVDGPRETHDRWRVFADSGRGTFDAVMRRIEDLRRAHPEYVRDRVRLSMVATPGADYARLARWLAANDLGALAIGPVADDTDAFDRAYRKRPVRGIEALRAEFAEAAADGTFDERRRRPDFSLHTVLVGEILFPLVRRPVPTSPADRAIRRGMCIPSTERLFVDCDGDLYPCEKTDGRRHLRIGRIETGVDVDRVVAVLSEFHEFLAAECSRCWAWRLCRLCLTGPTVGDGYDRARTRRVCEGQRRFLTDTLALYCSILERNPHGLDAYFADPVPHEGP